MVRINPPTNIKAIQFLGSPFRGKKAEELQAKHQAESQPTASSPSEPPSKTSSQDQPKSVDLLIAEANQHFKDKGQFLDKPLDDSLQVVFQRKVPSPQKLPHETTT